MDNSQTETCKTGMHPRIKNKAGRPKSQARLLKVEQVGCEYVPTIEPLGLQGIYGARRSTRS